MDNFLRSIFEGGEWALVVNSLLFIVRAFVLAIINVLANALALTGIKVFKNL